MAVSVQIGEYPGALAFRAPGTPAPCTPARAICRKFSDEGLHRTATAITLKLKRLAIERQDGYYSATKLAAAMGVDQHTVMEWIRRRWLAAEPRGTARTGRQGGDAWLIAHDDVRAFVFAHPEQVDLAKVEKWWFLALVTDGRISQW